MRYRPPTHLFLASFGIILLLVVPNTTGQVPTPDPKGALGLPDDPTADPEYEAALLAPPDAEDAALMTSIKLGPKCQATLTTRYDVDGQGHDAYEMDCPDYSQGGGQHAAAASTSSSCPAYPTPSTMNLRTKMWYTIYVDKKFAEERDESAYASEFHAFWVSRSDGRWLSHVYQPNFPSCVRWLMIVPNSINSGDVRTRDHLVALRNHEATFSDKGQVTVVLGWDQIYTGSRWANGLKIGGTPTDQSNLPAFYFHYPYGSEFGGVRLGAHEMGHAMGVGHTDCTTSMAGHGGAPWIHLMALSDDRHSSCKISDYHWHWIFKGPDAGAVDSKHVAWCNLLRGSTCPA